MRFLRLFESKPGVVERLFRKLVSVQVILTAVMRRRNPVSVSGSLVHFRGYLMRISWHAYLPRYFALAGRRARAISATRRPCNRAATTESGSGAKGTVIKPARDIAA
jgi:hypothetical protein